MRYLVLFLLLTAVSARVYDGFCLDVIYPDFVQVERGSEATFELEVRNTGPHTSLEDVNLSFDGQCSSAEYPCEYTEHFEESILWNHSFFVTIKMPFLLYDDPIKNQLYDVDGDYIGFKQEIVRINLTDCQIEQFALLIKPLYGNELITSIEENYFEVFQGDPVIFNIELENDGPEPFNIEFDEEGVAHRRVFFEPPSLLLQPRSKANVFVKIDTENFVLGTYPIDLVVITNALDEIKLNASFRVKAAGTLAQRQFEILEELEALERTFDLKLINNTYNVTDISEVRIKFENVRETVDEGYLSSALNELASAGRLIDELKPIVVEKIEEPEIIQEDVERRDVFAEDEITMDSFYQFIASYLWLIFLIILLFGASIAYVAYKGFFVPNTTIVKDVRYISDIEVKVKIRIRNKSMRAMESVSLLESLPPNFNLQSQFLLKDKAIPAEREDGMQMAKYRLDLDLIDPNSTVEIQYVMQKPKLFFKSLRVPESALTFKFRGADVALKSNQPLLGLT